MKFQVVRRWQRAHRVRINKVGPDNREATKQRKGALDQSHRRALQLQAGQALYADIRSRKQ